VRAASGALIYALRLKREMRWSVVSGVWRGMGHLAVPCLLLIVSALITLAMELL